MLGLGKKYDCCCNIDDKIWITSWCVNKLITIIIWIMVVLTYNVKINFLQCNTILSFTDVVSTVVDWMVARRCVIRRPSQSVSLDIVKRKLGSWNNNIKMLLHIEISFILCIYRPCNIRASLYYSMTRVHQALPGL